jgi:hypothetical protein
MVHPTLQVPPRQLPPLPYVGAAELGPVGPGWPSYPSPLPSRPPPSTCCQAPTMCRPVCTPLWKWGSASSLLIGVPLQARSCVGDRIANKTQMVPAPKEVRVPQLTCEHSCVPGCVVLVLPEMVWLSRAVHWGNV